MVWQLEHATAALACWPNDHLPFMVAPWHVRHSAAVGRLMLLFSGASTWAAAPE
jgi:hypothetical protein